MGDINAFEQDAQLPTEEQWDQMIYELAQRIQEDESKPAVLDLFRFQHMQYIQAALQKMTKGTGAKISYKLNEPFKSMGSVTVEGDAISFADGNLFATAAELADNMEVYPLTNGKVRLTFTICDLTNPLRVKEV